MVADNLIEKYAETPSVRALIQLIPNVGGAIDTLLYEKGSKWRQERIDYFIKDYGDKIEKLQKTNAELGNKLKDKIDTEEFYDSFIFTLKEAISSRHKEKIKLFSNVLLNYTIEENNEKEDIDFILNLVTSLSISEFIYLKNISEKGGKIVYHILENNHIVEMTRLKEYIENNKYDYDNVRYDIPSSVLIPESTMFIISRLQNMLLVESIKSDRMKNSIFYSWESSNQKNEGSIPYNQMIDIQLTNFGHKLIKWIKEQ